MAMEDVLELASRLADEAEVYAVQVEDTPVSFETNRLKILQTRRTSGLSLRLVKNGRVGFTSSTKPEAAKDIVERALAVAEFGAEAKFDFPTGGVVREVQVYDALVDGLSVDALVEMGQRMVDRMRAYNPEILNDVRVSRAVASTQILNSRGGSVGERKSVLSSSLSSTLMQGESRLDIYEGDASCRAGLDVDTLVAKVIEQFEQSKHEAELRTGELPVIFVPKAADDAILSPLIIGLNGKTVQQGASPLRGRVGEQVVDPRISVHDDATIDFATRSGATDDEGVPSQRTPLIEEGAVRAFFYDLQTAGLAGTRSTGNGFRSLESLPGPSTTNVIMGDGDMPLAEMIADIKNGLIVYQTMGAWAGNLLAGDFSANIHLGFKIENGRLVGRVKDTMVAGNVYEALKERLAAVGTPAEWVGGSTKLPALYFRTLSVSTKQ
ncbi:MAG: TldD/PmbA family protein [Chloroflexota bacterium]